MSIFLSKKLSNQTQANIRVEFCQVLMFYYKYELAEKQLIQAEDLLKFKFRITGVWGKRTKYQQFKTAQLVIYKVPIFLFNYSHCNIVIKYFSFKLLLNNRMH